MKKIKVLQLGIAAILLFCAVSCQPKTKSGITKVTVDLKDTFSLNDDGYWYHRQADTIIRLKNYGFIVIAGNDTGRYYLSDTLRLNVCRSARDKC
jgi:hypothetical protein